jgi:hypothetical protein
VRIVVGPATIANTKLDVELPLSRLAQAINPFRAVEPTTELRCAVVRLPLHDGVARIDRTLAAETKELGIAASGTLDFRNETVDLAFTPRARQGIPVDLAQIAELGAGVRSPHPRSPSMPRRRRQRSRVSRRRPGPAGCPRSAKGARARRRRRRGRVR